MNDQAQTSEAPPETVGRRQRSKHDKLRRIRAAAQRLFADQGFEATTTRQIAEEADIGTGTLFLYAKSKEELLVIVFQEDMVRIRDEAFATLPKRATLLDEVFHVYRAMSEFHERDRALGRVYAKEMAFVREPNRQGLHDFMNGIYELTERRIKAAKTRGEVAEQIPSRMLARNLFALYFSLLQSGLAEDVSLVSADHLGLLRESLALQLRGVAGEN
ncbi:MAG: TetR/AcrR family transcriptional regulator [Myxococcota bacterium]